MAKFCVTFKDPDSNYHSVVNHIVLQNNLKSEDVYELTEQYVDCGEYITLQFDTVEGSSRVLKEGEPGVDDWKENGDPLTEEEKEHNKRWLEQIPELERQIALTQADLDKEEDKTSKYARGLLRAIAETQEEIEAIKEMYS